MTAMKVGTGSWRRESDVMEAERVRRYSWQFWGGDVRAGAWVRWGEGGGGAYAAEEVAHEDYEDAGRDIGAGVEGLEGAALAVFVEDWVVLDAFEDVLGWEGVVCVDVAGEVLGWVGGVPA